VTIQAPPDSPNTDGIDPSHSRNVTISNCAIDTGGDNIAIQCAALQLRGHCCASSWTAD
jgi:polygalacturonase